ncbi:hypothetical protein B0H66DRAFT_535675 [Apodospora peruviana]|uniref:Uncharacterized protein n=1 Tax=Apodospora peruviana TaxID=516989 RepID=A0AAE0HXQ4_9PEZI|nr:hypothetical protein B0H66DRAFT_535675 [Apodospora peruviana]
MDNIQKHFHAHKTSVSHLPGKDGNQSDERVLIVASLWPESAERRENKEKIGTLVLRFWVKVGHGSCPASHVTVPPLTECYSRTNNTSSYAHPTATPAPVAQVPDQDKRCNNPSSVRTSPSGKAWTRLTQRLLPSWPSKSHMMFTIHPSAGWNASVSLHSVLACYRVCEYSTYIPAARGETTLETHCRVTHNGTLDKQANIQALPPLDIPIANHRWTADLGLQYLQMDPDPNHHQPSTWSLVEPSRAVATLYPLIMR